MDYTREIKLDYCCHNCKKCIHWLHTEYCAESSLMINEKGIVSCAKCKKTCNILDCKWKCIFCGIENYGNIHGLQQMFKTDKKEDITFTLKIVDQVKEQFVKRNEQSERGTFELSAAEKKEIQLFNYGLDDELTCGIKFRSTCPVQSCKEPDKINDWKHKPGCGGDILLYKSGNFGCSNCNFSKKFEEYKLKCESCSSLPAANFQISHVLEAISKYPQSKNLDKFSVKVITYITQRLNLDLKEIVFSSRCPVEKCSNNRVEYPWIHNSKECGERVFLNLKGEIYCKTCHQTWLFKDFLFNCSEHKAEKPSLIPTLNVLYELISQQTLTRNKIFFMEVLKKISKQFKIESLSEEIKEIKFETVCPIEQCSKKSTRYTWKHPICGKELLLTNEGKLRCKNCEAVMLFCDFPFKCEDHKSKLCTIKGAIDSIKSIKIPSTNKEAYNNFIIKLSDAIINQFENNPRVNEIDFIAPCPNVNCLKHCILFNWEHIDCGGQFKLTDKGVVRCEKCNFSSVYVDFPEQCCDCHCYSKDLTDNGTKKALCQINYTHLTEIKFISEIQKTVTSQLSISKEELFNKLINITNDDNSFIINNVQIYFVFPCPFLPCKKDNKIHLFLHPSCGGKLILRKKDWTLLCERCESIIPIEDFEFTCRKNPKKKIASYADINKAVDVLLNHFKAPYVKKVITEFRKTLKKSIDERNKKKATK